MLNARGLSVPSGVRLGLILAKGFNRFEVSRFGFSGSGVTSLLERLVTVVLVESLDTSLPRPKKSLAFEGWAGLLSCLPLGACPESAGLRFPYCVLAGMIAGAAVGGRRLPVRRLIFLFIMVPYLGANSRGSSAAQSCWTSRAESERTCRSCCSMSLISLWEETPYLNGVGSQAIDMNRGNVFELGPCICKSY